MRWQGRAIESCLGGTAGVLARVEKEGPAKGGQTQLQLYHWRITTLALQIRNGHWRRVTCKIGMDLESTSSKWATGTYKIALHIRGTRSTEMQATSERGREPQACCTVQPVLVDYHMSSAVDLNKRLAVRHVNYIRQAASPGTVPAHLLVAFAAHRPVQVPWLGTWVLGYLDAHQPASSPPCKTRLLAGSWMRYRPIISTVRR